MDKLSGQTQFMLDVIPVKFASLSASHTNEGLRSFLHGMPHDDDRLAFNGQMSSQKLKGHDPSYFAAVEEGLKG